MEHVQLEAGRDESGDVCRSWYEDFASEMATLDIVMLEKS